MKELYKMKLIPAEGGLSVWTNTYIVVRETPCYYFCVTDYQIKSIPEHCRGTKVGLDMLKARNTKLKRIAKENSRFAFETKELAYDNLLFLKRCQMVHMQRDMEFLREFIKFNKESKFENLDNNHDQLFVPNTSDLVNEYYCFD